MNVYLLIVVTMLWTHGSPGEKAVFSFQEFNSKSRCEQMAKWINTNYSINNAHAQCVPKEGN